MLNLESSVASFASRWLEDAGREHGSGIHVGGLVLNNALGRCQTGEKDFGRTKTERREGNGDVAGSANGGAVTKVDLLEEGLEKHLTRPDASEGQTRDAKIKVVAEQRS